MLIERASNFQRLPHHSLYCLPPKLSDQQISIFNLSPDWELVFLHSLEATWKDVSNESNLSLRIPRATNFQRWLSWFLAHFILQCNMYHLSRKVSLGCCPSQFQNSIQSSWQTWRFIWASISKFQMWEWSHRQICPNIYLDKSFWLYCKLK